MGKGSVRLRRRVKLGLSKGPSACMVNPSPLREGSKKHI